MPSSGSPEHSGTGFELYLVPFIDQATELLLSDIVIPVELACV